MDAVVLSLFFLLGFSCAVVTNILAPAIKSAVLAYRVRKAGREHARGPWQTKSSEEKAKDKKNEFEKFAEIVIGSNDAAMWWFKLGAIFWSRYQYFWVGRFVRGEFATWDQAVFVYDRQSWNNVLEMNRWQISNGFKEMAPRIDRDDADAAEFIKPILYGMKQAMASRDEDGKVS